MRMWLAKCSSGRHHVQRLSTHKVRRFNSLTHRESLNASCVHDVVCVVFSRVAIAGGRKIVLWQPQPAFNSPLR